MTPAGRGPATGQGGGDRDRSLLDFPRLRRQAAAAVTAVALLALAGLAVQGLAEGLRFGLMVRWGGIFAAGAVATIGVLVGVHAYRGARTAQQHGERLSGPDVGVLPPRRRR